MSSHKAMVIEKYTKFATVFKNHQLKLGYTHPNISLQLYFWYDLSFSTDFLQQFESVQLPSKAVRVLWPILYVWISDSAKAAHASEHSEELLESLVISKCICGPELIRETHINEGISSLTGHDHLF